MPFIMKRESDCTSVKPPESEYVATNACSEPLPDDGKKDARLTL
jgi:hypothetical protein